ncbi:MAG TPA: hypothetical protein VK699_05720 [Terriglobales bacterium]|jgi:hypothetical protein|nr:hypothetical protein [Terriglobales bacterium]
MQRWMNLALFLIVAALIFFSLLRSVCGVSLRATVSETKPPSSADTKIQDLQRALELNTPVQTTLVFHARVAPPSPQTQNKVAVQYAIDAQKLDFQHGADGREYASVECVAQAFTEKGEAVKASASTYEAALKPESFKLVSEEGFPCTQNLDLPVGNYLLKFAVRDNHTGLIGTLYSSVSVPHLPGAALPSAKRRVKRLQDEKPRSHKLRPQEDSTFVA